MSDMTRKEAKEIFLNRGFIDGIYDGNKWREACIVISKWLEQEPILDKIRAEINTMPCAITSMKEVYVNRDKVINILDKYKVESEG